MPWIPHILDWKPPPPGFCGSCGLQQKRAKNPEDRMVPCLRPPCPPPPPPPTFVRKTSLTAIK